MRLIKKILPRSNSLQSKKKHSAILRKKMLENLSITPYMAVKSVSKTACPKCHKFHTNEIDCICHELNILIRPAHYEESCFIFDMAENLFAVTSSAILSLQDHVSEVIYPFTKGYDFYRLNYNHLFNIYPLAIVKAKNVEDIANTIKFCRMFAIPLRARGGAHAYEPASLVNFGIILDQRCRDEIIYIDHKLHTVTIEAGALLGPIVNKLSDDSMLIPFGTCVTNGLAGLTLGGGIGFSLRQYGLTMDSVLDFEIVLADSEIIHANPHENKDLYWALRGAGGGNFGVVTKFTFEYQCIPYVTIFTFHYHFDDTKQVLMTWQKWAYQTISQLTSEMDIFNKYQPIVITGQLLPIHGEENDKKILLKLLRPLLDLDIEIDFTIQTMNLNEAARYFGGGSYARPLFFYNKSYFSFNLLPEEAIDVIIKNMSLLDQTQSYHKTEIDALGGNFGKISRNATAFPSRKAIYWFQFTSLWDIQNQEEENKLWQDKYYAEITPFFPEQMRYVNALDYNLTRDEALESYYGKNSSRLIYIKQKYDPDNFFKFEQSIPAFIS